MPRIGRAASAIRTRKPKNATIHGVEVVPSVAPAITAIAWVWFKQQLDTPALVGMGLILAGVLVINLFSKSAA